MISVRSASLAMKNLLRLGQTTRPLSTMEAREKEPAHIKNIVDMIGQLKFHEITLLNEALKRELRIPDLVMATGGASPNVTEDAIEEGGPSAAALYTVKLMKYDDTKKVSLIKEIKKLVEGINLVEAKRFVEECPRVIKNNLTKEEAEALQKQLEAAGGIVKSSYK